MSPSYGAEDDPARDARVLPTAAIRAAALAGGFDLVGITPAVTPAGFSHLVDWIAQGYHGTMEYIPRRLDAYRDPGRVLPGARTVLALALNYHASEGSGDPRPPRNAVAASGAAQIARYALPASDYHTVIRRRLRNLVERCNEVVPAARARGVVDTAPVLERDFAQAAGLGWFGKNTLLIHKRLGSWLFLAAVLLDVELQYDPPHTSSHCGTCTRCLDACPTQAFPAPHVLDARRCISYLTIESRELPPEELRAGMQDWLFGCDVCQEVCPWNRKAPTTTEADFQPTFDLSGVDPRLFLTLSPEQFAERFGKTPLARPGWWGLRRNALVVLGNRGTQADIPLLHPLTADPTLQPLADWAIGAIQQRNHTAEASG
ncbi:MAG: tRNA epoxyqueuosine(34) reductase QueG [Planctomycetaceae bacterium]